MKIHTRLIIVIKKTCNQREYIIFVGQIYFVRLFHSREVNIVFLEPSSASRRKLDRVTFLRTSLTPRNVRKAETLF